MARKKAKRKQLDRRPVTNDDIAAYVNFHVGQISKVFRGELKVTVICRHPDDPNAHFFMSEDRLGDVKAMIDEQFTKAWSPR